MIYKQLFIFLFFSLILSVTLMSASELPPAVLKIPTMVKEQSISTFVPSQGCIEGQGLAVNLIYPDKVRYKEGAPIVVVVAGENKNSGLDFSTHAAQQGFVELRFAFPGGGKSGFSSSGIYDHRGTKSQEALRDILRFAAGLSEDHQGKKIHELLPIKVLNKNVGAIGWSNGANILLITLNKFAHDLQFVSWLSLYESPVGSLFYPPALGGAQDMLLNKHYRQGTAATGSIIIDYKKLTYQNYGSKNPGLRKKQKELEIPGVLYFDENNNGNWDESSEYALPYTTDIGLDKQIYAPSLTRALNKSGKYTKQNWPKQIASLAESEAYFRERDATYYIKELVQNFPNLIITIVATQLDHLQRQADHPHIAFLYNAFLEQKIKFIRLNPAATYVATAAKMKHNTFIENKPNISIDADTIEKYTEPEGIVPDYIFVEASIAELSDRVYASKWSKLLIEPIVNYYNTTKSLEPKTENSPKK